MPVLGVDQSIERLETRMGTTIKVLRVIFLLCLFSIIPVKALGDPDVMVFPVLASFLSGFINLLILVFFSNARKGVKGARESILRGDIWDLWEFPSPQTVRTFQGSTIKFLKNGVGESHQVTRLFWGPWGAYSESVFIPISAEFSTCSVSYDGSVNQLHVELGATHKHGTIFQDLDIPVPESLGREAERRFRQFHECIRSRRTPVFFLAFLLVGEVVGVWAAWVLLTNLLGKGHPAVAFFMALVPAIYIGGKLYSWYRSRGSVPEPRFVVFSR